MSHLTVLSQRVDPNAPIEQQHAALYKTVSSLVNRWERMLQPLMPLGTVTTDLETLLCRVKAGEFYGTSVVTRGRLIDWELLEPALVQTIRDAKGEGPELAQLPMALLDDLSSERYFQEEDERANVSKLRLSAVQKRNGQPMFPGKWRKEPYSTRIYEKLVDYVMTPSIPEAEGASLRAQFDTPLDGFLGQAYNYDDHCLTEEWMVTFRDPKMEEVRDEDVIRTQVSSLLEILTTSVQDRVCNELQVLARQPIGLSVSREQTVWGIDCYTRRMLEIAIEDRVVPKELHRASVVCNFIDRIVLPAINSLGRRVQC